MDYQLHLDNVVALIPARAGSKRVPKKNTRLLGSRPLLEWSILAAQAADIPLIIVSTDDPEAMRIANKNGVEVHERKPEHATDEAPDLLWVNDVMAHCSLPIYSIQRPTSPFRTASTIRRCYAMFMHRKTASIRAVQPVREHPGKMWIEVESRMVPLMAEYHASGLPWHSSPTQTLPEVYVQNASLEMAWTARTLPRSITGESVAPFFTDPLEGFDINTEADFAEAERLALSVFGIPR